MKNFKELREAARSKTVILYLGEANPPTLQHLVTFASIKKIAESIKADYAIIISKNQNENTIALAQKLEYINTFYPGFNVIGGSDSMQSVSDVAEHYSKKYIKVIVAQSSDELNESVGYDVLSYGLHNPDHSMTSKKMHKAVNEGDYQAFRKGLLVHARDIDARRMFNDMRGVCGLDPIKEVVTFDTSAIRERYVKGEIFLENTFVESESKVYKIINRNSNYVTVSDDKGILSKKWLNNVQPIEASESIMSEFKGITEMKFSSSDKIKVAKIIGGILGADVSKGSNPEQMVNAGLRATRNKPLNAEAISILQKMLKTADDAGIAYDQKLVPTIVTDKKTGEEYDPAEKFDDLMNHPNTKSQFKRMKDEQGKGWTKSSAHGQNEGAVVQDTADYRVVIDPVTGKTRKVRTKRMVDVDALTKQDESFELDEVLTASHDVGDWIADFQDSDAPQFKGKSKEKRREMAIAAHYAAKRNESIDEASHKDSVADHIAYIKANVEKSHLNGERYVTLYKQDQAIADAHHQHLNSLGGKHVPLPTGHSMGGSDDQHIRRKVIYRTEAVDLDEAKHYEMLISSSKEPIRFPAENHEEAIQHARKHAARSLISITRDGKPIGKIGNNLLQKTKIIESLDSDEFESDAPDENISDEEIDAMIGHINDWDDVIDVYDSSELAYVDADSGEHVADVFDEFDGGEGSPDDSFVDEQPVVAHSPKIDKVPSKAVAESEELNEVLSRLERIKSKMRFHRGAVKRERALKVALKRHSSVQKLGHRARALAVKTMKMKIAKKPLNQLTIPEKERIERIIQRRASVINRIAVRLMPRIRKIEQTRLSHSNYTKKV